MHRKKACYKVVSRWAGPPLRRRRLFPPTSGRLASGPVGGSGLMPLNHDRQ